MARNTIVNLNKIWKDCVITKHTKIRLVRTMVFLTFLYEAETTHLKCGTGGGCCKYPGQRSARISLY